MNLNTIFPSRYLRAHELQGKEPVVTIDRVELEEMGRTREHLPVVYFRGKAKGLKLNKTMAVAVSQIARSDDTDGWPGTVVQLFATTAEFAKQVHQVIRIKAPVNRPMAVRREA